RARWTAEGTGRSRPQPIPRSHSPRPRHRPPQAGLPRRATRTRHAAYSRGMGRVTRRVPSTRLEVAAEEVRSTSRPDTLVVEEPLEIRVGGTPVTVTMRTPGDDFDLT